PSPDHVVPGGLTLHKKFHWRRLASIFGHRPKIKNSETGSQQAASSAVRSPLSSLNRHPGFSPRIPDGIDNNRSVGFSPRIPATIDKTLGLGESPKPIVPAETP
ncbi:MAG: hypothetical protein ACK5YO_10570, partial [Planctomyces sp.]